MTSTVFQFENQQIISTTPGRYQRGRGQNPVTEKLSDYKPGNNRKKELNWHRRDKSLSRLMNCRTVDKFDYVDTKDRPKTQKSKQSGLHLMQYKDVKTWMQAGAEIHADPWRFEYKIMFRDQVKGQCRYGDIIALLNAGQAQKIRLPHGYMKFVAVRE